MSLRSLAAALALFASLGLSAEQRILVPVFVVTRGAFGSAFRSELAVVNPGDTPQVVDGLNYPCVIFPACPPLPRSVTVAPRSFITSFDQLGTPGSFLYVSDSSPLQFGLRARDDSRRDDSAGTSIPIVREREFGPVIQIPDVRAEPAYRQLLRVYGMRGGEVVVAFRAENGALIESRIVRLPEGSRFVPAYAEVRDFPATPAERLWIEVNGTGDDPRVWAFVTLTNNATQEITVVPPSR